VGHHLFKREWNWIQEQITARQYYHGAQWTADEIKILKHRGQPAVTFNRMARKINSIVNAVYFMSCEWESGSKVTDAVVADGDHKSRFCHQTLERHSLIGFLNENIVGVAGEAITDSKKLLNPPRGSCRHACEMDMQMFDSSFLQSIPEVNCLKKTVFVSAICLFLPVIGESPCCPTGRDFEKRAV